MVSSFTKKAVGMSIKSKLILFALCISLIPVTILTVLYYFHARSSINKYQLNNLTAITRSKSLHVMSILNSLKSRTLDFSTDGFIRDSVEAIHRGDTVSKIQSTVILNRHLLLNKMTLDKNILGIDILDMNGETIASTNEDMIGKNQNIKKGFVEDMDINYEEPYINTPHFCSSLGKNCLSIFMLITTREKSQPSGFLVNNYDLAVLNEITTMNVEIGESGEVLLGMERGGDIVFLTPLRYSNRKPLDLSIPTVSLDGEPMRRALKGMNSTVIAHDYRGIDVVSAYQHIPIMDWGLVAKIDKKEAFYPLMMLTIIAIIVGSVSTALVVSAGIVFAVSLSRPIRRLTHAAERVAQGDLEFDVEVPSKDEVGILAESFNTMRIQLDKLVKNIEKGRKEWESTFDSVRDIICLWDTDSRLIRCNKALLEKYNLKPENIIGKKCVDIFHQMGKKDVIECTVIETLRTMKSVTKEIEVPDLNGFFNISCFPHFDDREKFIGIIQIMKDITERKRSDEALRASEVKYQDLYDNAPDMFASIDVEQKVINCNKTMVTALGYNNKEEIIGKDTTLIYHPDCDRERKKVFQSFIKYGETHSEDLQLRRKDGSKIHVSLRVSAVRDEQGKVLYSRSIWRNISDRKHVEAELQKYSRQLDETNNILKRKNKDLIIINEISSVFPQSPRLDKTLDNILARIQDVLQVEFAGIYLVNRKSGFLELKRCRGFSKTAVEALENQRIGERFFNLVAKSQKPLILEDIKRDKFFSSSIIGESVILSITVTPLISQEKVIGTLFLSASQLHRFNDEDIPFFTMIGNQIGISIKNCQLFEEISENEEKWENTFNTISDSICIVDKNFRIIKTNNGTADLIGMKTNDILDKTCYEVFYGLSEPHENCPIKDCIEGRNSESCELFSIKYNKLFSETVFTRRDKDNTILDFVHIVRDITKERAFEDQMRTSYKMASLGRLTAGVFHEILNPVNIISSHIQLLLMEAEKGSKTEDDLNSIREEIDRIVQITDSLLRFSRKEKSKTEDIDINDILERVINIVEPQMKLQQNIEIMRNFDLELLKTTANSGELRQVFLNLITNARDAIQKDGTITITTRMLAGNEFSPEKPVIRIEFTDTGTGIKAKNIEYVFDPFFTTKKEGEGTGLGLSESYSIIQNHGGVLSVKSEPEKGSTFIIDLPVDHDSEEIRGASCVEQ